MNRCISVRKKGSGDQCLSRALAGHTLCGRHARMKHPMLWADVYSFQSRRIARLQAIVRGWLLRRRLALAGPGVLRRTNLANTEELMTCDEAGRVSPLDYFAFEEGGKVWWFSFESLWKWCIQSIDPVNPYTKVPLTTDTRKRLREIYARRMRSNDLFREALTYEDRLRHRWNILCQLFRDNGFVDIEPGTFLRFNKSEYMSMFVLLYRDLPVVLSEKDPQRDKILWYCRRGMLVTELSTKSYILHATYILIWMLTAHKDPYSMVFTVLSAFYRC